MSKSEVKSLKNVKWGVGIFSGWLSGKRDGKISVWHLERKKERKKEN